MKNFAHFGKVALPRGIFADLKEHCSENTGWKLQLERNGVGGVLSENPWWEPIYSKSGNIGDHMTKFHQWLDSFDIPVVDPHVLLFKSVEPHTDEWGKINVKGRKMVTGFLHLVVGGTFHMKYLGKIKKYSRGDLFIMNPNLTHEVKTNSKICATLHAEVPLKLGIETLSKTFQPIEDHQ